MEILTNNFNSDINRMFITDTVDNQNMYMFVSTIGTFNPVDSAVSQNEFLENTLFGKKIHNDDINYMIKYYPWQRGTVYTQYDDKLDLDGLKFYAVVGPNDNDTGDYRIYKCLNNKSGAVAESPPTWDAANLNQIYETADGYVWKYMYKLSTLQFEGYNALGYIPIDPTANTSPAAASGGGVSEILVNNILDTNGYEEKIAVLSNLLGRVEPLVQGDVTMILDPTTLDWDNANNYYTGQYAYITNPSSSVTNLFDVLDYDFNVTTGNAEIRVGAEVSNPSRGNIEAATVADPVVITSTAHGLAAGQPIRFRDVFGMVELNAYSSTPLYVKVVDEDSFQLYTSGNMDQNGQTFAATNTTLNGTGFTAWTSGGTYNADKDLYVAGVQANATVKIFPKVKVTGDGVGAVGIPTITNGKIVNVILLNRGTGYNNAVAAVLDPAKGFDPLETGSTDVRATLTPILEPKGGHAYDLLEEFKCKHFSFYGYVTAADNTNIGGVNTYGAIGIVRDPQFRDGPLADPAGPNWRSASALGLVPEIFDNRIAIVTNDYLNLTANSTITQLDADNNITFKAQVHEIVESSNTVYFAEYMGPYQNNKLVGNGDTSFDPNSDITSDTGQRIAINNPVASNVIYSDYIQRTGEVYFMEDFFPLARTELSREEFKFVLEF